MTIAPKVLERRPRRNRKSASLRELVQETRLTPAQLIVPLFVTEGEAQIQEIDTLPGVFRYSIDKLVPHVQKLFSLGVRAVDLFPAIPPELKDSTGSEALRKGNLLERALVALKNTVPEMCLMVDVALDPYTDHGHDGVVSDSGEVLNDPTLEILAEMSLHAAKAGADIIAPSDMMDGRVAAIRKKLDSNGYTNVNILSYTAKYASSFYGPFRGALGSTLKFGDKKTYQMNPANRREALIEAELDEQEGADMLMCKPALAYLDVIAALREKSNLPIAAYHVSGEYAMVIAAADRGWLNADEVFLEQLISIRRAGADMILTYAAERVIPLLK